MPDYKKLYLTLFNQITDTISLLESEKEKLIATQIKTEEEVISDEDKIQD